jgi:NADH-quinone oxidoreductase subunit C
MAEPETPPVAGAETEHPLLARLRAAFPGAVISTHQFRGDATAIVAREKLIDICRWLRDDPDLRFDMLMDVTAVDFLGRSPRFEVVYHFYSLAKNHRVRLKVPLEEADPKVPSVVSLWAGANWLERETYDLYGIRFDGHPDLRRIYLYEEFQGHPLRKDYPKEQRQPLIGPGAPGAAASGGGSGTGS